MKYIVSLLLISLFVTTATINSYSQNFNSFKDGQYYIGGDLQLSFSSTVSYYKVAPEISFGLYDNVHVGLGLLYSYYSDRYYTPTYNASNFGFRLFTRVFPLESIYFHAEYERTFFKDKYTFNPNGTNTIGFDAINLGIGLINGDRDDSYYYVAILYNALDKEFFFGYNPFLRAGFVWAL